MNHLFIFDLHKIEYSCLSKDLKLLAHLKVFHEALYWYISKHSIKLYISTSLNVP